MPSVTGKTAFGNVGQRFLIALRMIVCALLLVAQASAQDADAGKTTAGKTPSEQIDTVAIETIVADIKAVEDDAELKDEEKTELKGVLNQAKSELERAEKAQNQSAQFEANIQNAKQDLAATAEAKQSVQAYDFNKAQGLDLNALNQDRADLEQQIVDSKKALNNALAEPQRRVDRTKGIATELSQANKSLEETEEKLKAIELGDAPSLTLLAQYRLQLATRQAWEATIESLNNERSAYEAQGELPRLRIDVATSQLKQLEDDFLKLVDLITKRRKTDAKDQMQLATTAYDDAPKILKPFAEAIVNGAQFRLELAGEIQQAAAERDQTNKEVSRWSEEAERTKKRTEAVGSGTVGAMLVERRSEIPSTTVLQARINEHSAKLRKSQFKLYELEDRRVDLSDVDADVEKALAKLKDEGAKITPELRSQLKQLFDLELVTLDSLLIDANRNYQIRIDSRDQLQKLVDELRAYREYINQKVFWVRSAPTLQLNHLQDSRQAVAWIFNRQVADEIGIQVKSQLAKYPFKIVISTLAILLLFVMRPRLRRILAECGERASTISCEEIRPTLQAIWVTLLLATSVALLVWGISGVLHGSVSSPVRAISFALDTVGLWVFSFELIRQLWRPGGLADAHFSWAKEAAPEVKRFSRIVLMLGTPLIFFGSVFQQQGDPIFLASLGRISIILLLLLIAVCSYRLLRTESHFFTERLFGTAAEKLRTIVIPASLVIPIGIALMSVNGYQYAAHALTVNVLLTFSLLIGVSVLRALLFRWVRITRRRLRKKQLLESRERTAETEESDTGDIDALAAKEADVDLVLMDRQTRRLITLGVWIVGVCAVYWIWADVARAANPLLDTTVYSIQVAKDVSEPITLGSILFALLAITMAVIGWRNIPGLVDVFLLGKIQIESSVRYAIATMSQYILAIAGAIVACNSLGLTWGRMQWLVAAMGVGLGFGLQEVVANFVSGIILLFERPIRVGDIVTLGDTTGVVIRIRSRATTVRNWDRQEVVIPNKELITSRITNWTLSDQMNRIVIQVGVAYGSDSDHIMQVLHDVLEENPNVLDDPRPLVTFEQFGDSAINFIVRAFLVNMDNRLSTIHDLHNTIYQRFSEEKIEIPFPQQDLHLRSIDDSVSISGTNRSEKWQEPNVESGS